MAPTSTAADDSVQEQPKPSSPLLLKVKRLSPNAVRPSRGSAHATGYDLSSAVSTVVPARGRALVATDLCVAVPEGTYGRIEHLNQVMAKRNAANSRVTQLEKRLAALEKEAAAAKKEAITATQRAERAEEKEQAAAKQEEELIPRVAAVVNIIAEILSSPHELIGRVRVNALVDSVTSTEEQVAKFRTTMEKILLLLNNFFQVMFPIRELPEGVDNLLKAFSGTSALVDFSRAQTLSGAETVIALTQAHGARVDFDAVFSRFPVDSKGNEVALQPFEARAGILSEKLMALLEAREKEIEEIRAREAMEQ